MAYCSIQKIHFKKDDDYFSYFFFCIMNTISLIFVIAISAKGGNLGLANYLYILFFFGNLIPVLSLYMTTFCWKDVTELEEQ
jgi:hypothetical protein